MNKLFISMMAFIAATALNYAGDLNSLHGRGAAFIPMSHKFREIYGHVGASVQAEYGRTFEGLRNFGIWGNGEWICMNGNPKGSCGSTGIDLFNISFGFKGIGHFLDDTLFLYGGIGPDIGLVYVENKMRCCTGCPGKTHHRSRLAVGGLFKAGFQVNFTPNLFFDFFADYLYLPVHFHSTVDVGGFKLGGGFGGRF